MSWEQRMSQRAAERARLAPPEPDSLSPRDEHIAAGHHWHFVPMNGIDCSCGEIGGCFSYVPDERWWSADPSQVAAVAAEEQLWIESLSCSICGRPGVQWEQDWGATAAS
jgi:hypothetical protein